MSYRRLFASASASAAISLLSAMPTQAHFIGVGGNNSIDGSLCVGFDCVAEESFGFDTIRMKENNVRLHYQDTSSAASFPDNDWRIEINSSANGGSEHYAIQDASAGRNVVVIEAGAPSSGIRLDSVGNVGISEDNPVLELHITDGDTPAMRLEQDGSSGFTPQTWDVAGNETNFFIRDVTSGSALPFKILDGAPNNALVLETTTGDVGMGTQSPTASLHVRGTDGSTQLFVEEAGTTAANRLMMRLVNNGSSQFSMENTANSTDWRMQNFGGNMQISLAGSGGTEFLMDGSGNLTVRGNIVSGGGGTCDPGPCDAVFDPAVYTVPSIEDHAAFMWENKRLPALDPTLPGQPINLTLKLTRMLNELEHAHIYIEQLHKRVEELESKL